MTRSLIGTTCSCCGGDCPTMTQWHNRDTGFSVCKDCIAWLKGRGTSDEEIHENYGVAGVHYEDVSNAN